MNIQRQMMNVLQRMVEEGRERGIQLAAYYRGELVVDAWAGVTDSEGASAVNGSTLFPVFSTTKGIAATVIHLLAERNKLDYDTRICELWPEFGGQGKAEATVGHALSHTTGIPQMPEGIVLADLANWSGMCSKIAGLAPQWEPGRHFAYHAMTFGWIVGEIARRVDGRSFSHIVKQDICEPLAIGEELYVGIPREVESRVATLEAPEFDPSTIPPTGPQAIPPWILPLHAWMNRSDARQACIPASNGIMTARAIARHYAALLPGGVDGVELLPSSRMRLATQPLRLPDQPDVTMSKGYFVGAPGSIMGSRASAFGHGGYGGSVGFADPDHQLAVGFVNNRYTARGAGMEIIHELKQGLGIQ